MGSLAGARRMIVAFDLARLFIGSLTPTPRGIDRVDIAYGRHFLEHWSGDCVGVLPTPWGVRWFSRERSLRVVNFIEDYWRETDEPTADPAFQWVKGRLHDRSLSIARQKPQSSAVRLARGIGRFFRQHGFAFGSPVATLPAGTVYINTGQIVLAVPRLVSWLASRQDVKPVFMLHDAIPIENPEYTPAYTSRAHGQMLVSTARFAQGLIVTTQAAGKSIKRELARLGCRAIPVIAAALPVPLPFLKPFAVDPDLRDSNYFVICGAIEPRKNHLLLLNVWREMIVRNDQKVPKLVVIGSRWHTNDAVIDMLEKCALLKGHVIEVEGLSSPALRQLLSAARALLMPSFAEGFGIPIIEALAVGTPVIASDLASHREAGGASVTYLSPLDGLGWLAAIEARTKDQTSNIVRRRSIQYRPQTSADYFRQIEQFIGSV